MSEEGFMNGFFRRLKAMLRRNYLCPDCGGVLNLRECGWQCTKCSLIMSSIDVKNKVGVIGDKRIYESTELKVGKGWLVKDE